MIRLIIVDDHAVVRRGLTELFAAADDVDVVALASGGEEAVTLVAEHSPDVVLMDLSMPDMDGVEATRQICKNEDHPHIVILTSFSERERILDAVAAGAAGYLLKDADPEELVRGVRAAAQGDAPFSPKAAKALLPEPTDRPRLTDREREVLSLVAGGFANKQIARKLGISEKTVKAHLTNVFASIGVSDRTQAALWAGRHGIAPARED